MRCELLFAIILGGLLLPATQTRAAGASPAHHERTNKTFFKSDSATSATDDFLNDDDWRKLPEAERSSRMRRMTLARYEPSGTADPARLDDYLRKFEMMNVYDPRVYLFKVTALRDPSTTGDITLIGEVSVPQFRTGLESTLKALGFNVVADNIEVLPSKSLGSKIYGLSTTTAATLRKEPRSRSEQVNSVSMGGWVRLLRRATANDITTTTYGRHHSPNRGSDNTNDEPADWYLAQSLEGYLGFVRASDFKLHDDFTVPEGIVEAPTTISIHGSHAQLGVPAGALVYQQGNAWRLFDGELLPKSSRVHSLVPTITAAEIIADMKPFLDTKYVWGGTTDHGIDCSGFTQFFMRLRGTSVPRDAEQQATSGFIVAWGPDILKKAKPGDIIFFESDSGRISHVAISLGGNNIIHSAGEGVHFSKLTDSRHGNGKDTLLDGAMFARRILVR